MNFSLSDIAAGLPAASLIPPLTDIVGSSQTHAVVVAPPGTGKTTVVPPTLANHSSGRVVVTQPRRVAARAAAVRLAALSNTPLGERVGYAVRGEQRSSNRTRVEFVTDGLLVRRLLHNPELDGVSCIVLDEIHERSLDSDLAAAMLRELASLRDDLTIVAMSATADAARWQEFFGAQLLEAQAPIHPLTERWCPMTGHRLDARGPRHEFLQHLAEISIAAHHDSKSNGAANRVLTFVPGVREAERVTQLIQERGIAAAALHGSLTLQQQQRVLEQGPGGDVIVATTIAESSLTVPGVRTVVDSGLARESRIDSTRGVAQLVTIPASKAAAIQRAGRAARLGPGVVYRGYDHTTWGAMPPHPLPEIATSDFAQAALTLAAWHGSRCDLALLPEQPPAAIAQAAFDELESLGALSRGELTDFGRTISSVATHPRLATALIKGASRFGKERAATLVAVLASNERAPDGDLLSLARSLQRGEHHAAKRFARDRNAFLRAIPDDLEGAAEQVGDTDDALATIVALAYPDQLARVRDREQHQTPAEYLTAAGLGARCTSAALSGAQWLAVSELQRTPSGNVIRAAVPISFERAQELGSHLVQEHTRYHWHGLQLRATRARSLGAITLTETPTTVDAATANEAVRARINRDGVDWLKWSRDADRLRRRLALAHHILGDPWPEVTDAALAENLNHWFAIELDAVARGTNIETIDLAAPLRRLLPWPEATRFDELFPERIEVPSGSNILLEYPSIDRVSEAPILAVKLQECFGWQQSPSIADGRVQVVCHLLSPAGRPLAVTADLASFWAGPYAQVRAEMRGRYPKHPWPEDPLTATATRHTNARVRNNP